MAQCRVCDFSLFTGQWLEISYFWLFFQIEKPRPQRWPHCLSHTSTGSPFAFNTGSSSPGGHLLPGRLQPHTAYLTLGELTPDLLAAEGAQNLNSQLSPRATEPKGKPSFNVTTNHCLCFSALHLCRCSLVRWALPWWSQGAG